VRLGAWPARLVLVFLVLHTAMQLITYRRRRQRDRAANHHLQPLQPPQPLERGTPA
jgi:apolipoprotein N-acyltransferase